jgi:hypothetical protein
VDEPFHDTHLRAIRYFEACFSDFAVRHWLPGFSAIYPVSSVFYPLLMGRESSILHVGDAAPNFLLTSANGTLAYQLSQALKDDPRPMLLEFLRGTW